jgi:hypothetical protein
VTPFDPVALVAMLVAFYPVVSAAAFLRARSERAEYFAGGTIFGSKGDKLRLPDGREFDCIVAAGGPVSGRRWQCSLIDPNAPGGVDPFPLEDGPLAPLDEEIQIFPGDDESFEALVAGHLAGFGSSAEQLDDAASAVAESDGSGALEDSFARTIEPAIVAAAANELALDAVDPSEVAQAADGNVTTIDDKEPTDVEDEPPDIPDPNPGPLPI